jgi:hypothetical protein
MIMTTPMITLTAMVIRMAMTIPTTMVTRIRTRMITHIRIRTIIK